jgi:HPt (histidine-containing phosphotransfer) domain-containing protein
MSAVRHDGAGEILLDLEQLRALADLEADASGVRYLTGLYELFAGDARQALERMRAWSRQGDASALAREAHRLKGSSGSIGASGFSRHCRDIEACARMQGEDLDAHIDQAMRQLETTVSALRDYVRRRELMMLPPRAIALDALWDQTTAGL